MVGAKSEAEIITISTNFSFVSYDTDDSIFNVSLLDLDFCLNIFHFSEFKVYFVCLVVYNIAAVTITVYKCIYLMVFTMCDYVTACFLFFH